MASQPSISGVIHLLDVYESTMKDLLIASTASGLVNAMIYIRSLYVKSLLVLQ